MVNYYELLGINPNASSEEIKQAYRKMAKKYHPDVNKDENADKIIRSLNEAKETLLDEVKRKEYDVALEALDNSKEFSKEKSETYESKKNEYRETYSETYVTRWEYYKNYINYAKDNFFVKFLKSLFALINHVFVTVLKWTIYVFVYILFVINDLIDYLAGLLMLGGVISFFALMGKESPNVIPYVPANVEGFLMFTILAVLVEFIKILIYGKYGNLFSLMNKLENKVLIKILNI